MNKYLLTNERLYLRSPNINVCFRLIIKGNFDNFTIENSLKKVSKKHPFINCSLEINNSETYLVEKENLINPNYYGSNEMTWEKWYKKTDNIPFDFFNEALLRICVIRGENTEIIFLGHHIIGDGIAYLNLIKDFISCLDGGSEITAIIPPRKAEDKYFKHTILPDQGTKDYAKWLNNEWRKNKTQFSEDDFKNFFQKYRKEFRSSFYTSYIEGEELNKLLSKTKKLNVTVNEMISGTFSLAFMDQLNKDEVRLGIAADIRNELVSEPCYCMGNYVTGISETITNSSDDFNIILKNISSQIRNRLNNPQSKHLAVHFLNEFDNDLIEATMLAVYGKLDNLIAKQLGELMSEGIENKGLGISNLGKHNLSNYKNIKIIDLQFIGPTFPANLITVDAITVNNKLNFCLRYNENEISRDIVKNIYNQAIKSLI